MSQREPRNGLMILATGIIMGLMLFLFINFICGEIRGRYFDYICPWVQWVYIVPGITIIAGIVIQIKNDQPVDTSK